MSALLLERLYSVLSTAAGVTALVGDRIYPSVPVQNVDYPQISFDISAAEIVPTLAGATGSGLEDTSVTVECWADSALEAQRVADAVIAAMDASTALACTVASSDSDYESLAQRYVASVDLEIWNYLS